MLGPATQKQWIHALQPQGRGRGQREMILMGGLSERHKTERKRKGEKEGGEEGRIQELARGIRVSENSGVYLPFTLVG